MIGIKKEILEFAKKVHVSALSAEIDQKVEMIKICGEALNGKIQEIDFLSKVKSLKASFHIKKSAINFFLKEKIKEDSNSPKVTNEMDFRLIFDTSRLNTKLRTKYSLIEIKRISQILTKRKIIAILEATPQDLLNKHEIPLSKLKCSNKQTKKELLSYLFDYTAFASKSEKYDAYQLTLNLKADSCLYCNRTYTATIVKEKNKIIRPELDHFFPKNKYLWIKLSFYNLIPSCHICNSTLKGKTDFDLKNYFHPYLGSFDDYDVHFTYKPENPSAFDHTNYSHVDIRLNTDHLTLNKTQITNNILAFKLNEIYNYHAVIAKNLMELKRFSNHNYLEKMRTKVFIDDNNESLFQTNEEVFEIINNISIDSAFFSEHPFSKFKYDIALELGLITKTKP